MTRRGLIVRRLVLAVLQRRGGSNSNTSLLVRWVDTLGVGILHSVMPWTATVAALEQLKEDGLVKQEQSSANIGTLSGELHEIIHHVWRLTYDGWVLSVGLDPDEVVEEALNAVRLERAGYDAGEGCVREAGTTP